MGTTRVEKSLNLHYNHEEICVKTVMDLPQVQTGEGVIVAIFKV
jgi:hypothetical protein